MTWAEIADEQKAAAQRLIVPDRIYPRAACSRAYYAAYALIASLAPPGFAFPHGWSNPGHHQLSEIIKQLKRIDRIDLEDLVNRLVTSRVDADYGAGKSVSAVEARERVRDCVELFNRLR